MKGCLLCICARWFCAVNIEITSWSHRSTKKFRKQCYYIWGRVSWIYFYIQLNKIFMFVIFVWFLDDLAIFFSTFCWNVENNIPEDKNEFWTLNLWCIRKSLLPYSIFHYSCIHFPFIQELCPQK